MCERTYVFLDFRFGVLGVCTLGCSDFSLLLKSFSLYDFMGTNEHEKKS